MIYINIGDYVSRNKYGNDIIFVIKNIIDDNYILVGKNVRLIADAKINDLSLVENVNNIENFKFKLNFNNKCFYIPGVVLHIDSDLNYIRECDVFYKNNSVKAFLYLFDEVDYCEQIVKLIYRHRPNIVIITGHDSLNKNGEYKNSSYFCDCVKLIRKEFGESIVIFSGACQSNFKMLIKCGCNFASSPYSNNIGSLDPAIIGVCAAYTLNSKYINLVKVINYTKYGKLGIGGIKSLGTMKIGYPNNE